MTETLSNPNIGPLPTQEFQIQRGGAVEVIDGLTPIEEMDVCLTTSPNDAPEHLYKLAEVNIPNPDGTNMNVVVATPGFDQNDRPTAWKLLSGSTLPVNGEANGSKTYAEEFSNPASPVRRQFATGTLHITPGASKYDKSVGFSWSTWENNTSDNGDIAPTPTVIVAEQARGTSQGSIERARSSASAERVRRFGRGLIVAAGIMAAVKTGGLVDQAMNPFQDTRAVVAEAGAALVPDAYGGIAFDSLPENQQEQIRESVGDGNDTVERVSQTMQDLQEGNQSAIKARAEVYKAHHSDEYISDERKQQIIERIDSATTNEDALAALSDFTSSYGKNVEFADTDQDSMSAFDKSSSVTDVQATAHNIVDAFTLLPTQKVKNAGFSTIELATTRNVFGSQAQYSGYGEGDKTGKMYIPVYSAAIRGAEPILNAMPDAIQDPLDLTESVIHEFRHSEQPYSLLSQSGSPDASLLVEHVPRYILDKPEDVSQNAATRPLAEKDAEAFAHTIDPDYGPANPRETRLFSSGANKRILGEILQVEQVDPGATDYIVSRNKKLMDTMPGS